MENIELTAEQRQQIFQEEKARLEIRQQLERESFQSRQPVNDAQAKPTQSNGIAAVLSLVIPGAGQMYKDKVGTGMIWLFGTVLGYMCLIVPGVIVHLLCVANALSTEVGVTSTLSASRLQNNPNN